MTDVDISENQIQQAILLAGEQREEIDFFVYLQRKWIF